MQKGTMGFRLNEQQDCSEDSYYNFISNVGLYDTSEVLPCPPTQPALPTKGISDNNSNQDNDQGTQSSSYADECKSEYIRKRAQQLSRLASCIGSGQPDERPRASYQQILDEPEDTSHFNASLCLDGNTKNEIRETLKKIADLVNGDVCELNQPLPNEQYDTPIDHTRPPDNMLPFDKHQRPHSQPPFETRQQPYSRPKSENRQKSFASAKLDNDQKSFSSAKLDNRELLSFSRPPIGNNEVPPPEDEPDSERDDSVEQFLDRHKSVASAKLNNKPKSFASAKLHNRKLLSFSQPPAGNSEEQSSEDEHSEQEDSVEQSRDVDLTDTKNELPPDSALHVMNQIVVKKEVNALKCSDAEIDDLRDKVLGIISLIDGNTKTNCGCPTGESGDTDDTQADLSSTPSLIALRTGVDNQQRQGSRSPKCCKFRIIVLILLVFNCSLIAYGCANVLTEGMTVAEPQPLGYIGVIANDTDTRTTSTTESKLAGQNKGEYYKSRHESLEQREVLQQKNQLDLSEKNQKALCESEQKLFDADGRLCSQSSCRIVKRNRECPSTLEIPSVELPPAFSGIQLQLEKEEEIIYANKPEVLPKDVEPVNEKQPVILEEYKAPVYKQFEPESTEGVSVSPDASLNEDPPTTSWQKEYDHVAIKDQKHLYPPRKYKCGVERPSDADPHFVRKCQERLEEQLATKGKGRPFSWCDYNFRWMAYIINNQRCS